MQVHRYTKQPSGEVIFIPDAHIDPASEGEWAWIDISFSDSEDVSELLAAAEWLELDPGAVRDAIEDRDLPKLDDFGSSLLLVLSGLRDEKVETYEVDCFVTERLLLTIHNGESPAITAFGAQLTVSPPLSAGGLDELLARLTDVFNRRLLSVVHAFDDIADDLLVAAVEGEPSLLRDLVAVRRDIAAIRRSMQPQLEAISDVIASDSHLIGDAARRRFSDARDVAVRAIIGLDSARSVMAETLEAYRGAEARQETQVTKVLTIYAAIMLPLTLLVGFFGMNVPDLPFSESDSGWWILLIVCIVIAAASLGVFVSLGWIKRPSGRGAGRTLGRGLVEAARTPVQVAGALYEVVLTPLRRKR